MVLSSGVEQGSSLFFRIRTICRRVGFRAGGGLGVECCGGDHSGMSEGLRIHSQENHLYIR